MKVKKFCIFGKVYEVIIEDEKIYFYLNNWINNYKETQMEADVIIKFISELDGIGEVFYNSPKEYKIYKNRWQFNISGNPVIFEKKGEKLFIYINYKYDENFFKSSIKKFLSLGYFNKLENVGAFFYEMVLVFSQFLFDDRVLIHSSAVKKGNKVILFGGSGGVGKTSLELLLCRDLDFTFIADDISVVDKKGYVYPNLAYPKIYAYNTINNNKLLEEIFENRNIFDKFQWTFKRVLKGDSSVRRAINPKKLYKNIETNKSLIDTYYILQRTNEVDNIVIEDLDLDIATQATLLIMQNEYGCDIVHYRWGEYNHLFLNNNPLINTNEMFNRWIQIYRDIFKDVELKIIKIPSNISHNDLILFFRKYFERI